MQRLAGWKISVVKFGFMRRAAKCLLPVVLKTGLSVLAMWETFLTNRTQTGCGSLQHHPSPTSHYATACLWRTCLGNLCDSVIVYRMPKLLLWNAGSIFTFCERLDFIAGLKVRNKWQIRAQGGPKWFKTTPRSPARPQRLHLTRTSWLLLVVVAFCCFVACLWRTLPSSYISVLSSTAARKGIRKEGSVWT